MGNVEQRLHQVIRVEGIGGEKHQAFANALNKIHGQVLKEKNDVIIRIEPIGVTVVKAEQETYMERFLFIFMPRKRADYRVTLDIEVEITSIEMATVPFIEKTVSAPNSVPLSFFKKKRLNKEAN